MSRLAQPEATPATDGTKSEVVAMAGLIERPALPPNRVVTLPTNVLQNRTFDSPALVVTQAFADSVVAWLTASPGETVEIAPRSERQSGLELSDRGNGRAYSVRPRRHARRGSSVRHGGLPATPSRRPCDEPIRTRSKPHLTRGRRILDWSLLTIAVGALSAWFALTRRDPTVDVDSDTPFLSLKDAPPTHLTITRGDRSLRLERPSEAVEADAENERYVVRSVADPKSTPVDPAALDRLLNSISALEIIRDVPKPQTLKQLGLEPPELSITLERDGHRSSLQLGGTSHGGDRGRYARILVGDRTRVVVLANAAAAGLEIDPEDLVDRRLIDAVPSEIRRLTLAAGFQRVVIEQTENGRFWLSGAVKRRASRERAETVLLALTELELAPRGKPVTREAKPTDFVVTLEPREPQRASTQVLRFGEPCEGDDSLVTVTLEGPTRRSGCATSRVLTLAPLTEADWLESRLTFLHGDEVERLTIRGNVSPFVLERKGAAYEMHEPEVRAVTLQAGNALLDALTHLEGTRLGRCGTDFHKGSSEFVLRSGLVGHTGPSDDRLWVGSPNSDGSRTVCRDDDEMLSVDAASASALDVSEATLRDPERLNYPVDAIFAVEIRSEAGFQRLTTDDENHLTLRDPNLPGDAATIESLREQLAQLTVERWLPQTARVTLPMKRVFVRFQAKDDTGTRRVHELEVERGSDGRAIGRLDRDPAKFQLKDAMLQLLDGLVVDRSMYRLLDSDFAFSLSRGKDQIDCSRTPRGFHCSSPRLTERQSTKLVEALQALRAIRVEKDATSSRNDREELTLRIFTGAAATKRARFVLRLVPEPQDTDRHWTAKSASSTLTFVYDAAAIRPLLDALEGDGAKPDAAATRGTSTETKPN
ncbi:MAG: DUF4340 domain-containing protein [Polyangiaceae bacterium]